MPILRGGQFIHEENEATRLTRNPELLAENKPGHRPLTSYDLPKWCYHPDKPNKQSYMVEKSDFFGMAADGTRNYENWNVAHVAAYHDDFKLLSLATPDELRAPNKWGMTPAHMCALGVHPYGPSLCVLYELAQLGAADPEAENSGKQTPIHICNLMHKSVNQKKFEKVLLKGFKPEQYEERKKVQLKPRGASAKALTQGLGDAADGEALPVCLTFPGQGSQYAGMIKDVAKIDSVKAMLAKAEKILGWDVLEVCLNGPEDKLAQTKYCQPAMFIASLAALEKLKIDEPAKVANCQAVAGLSLGEYTALVVAEVLSFEDCLELVKVRGEAMENETTKEGAQKQAMLSVAGLEQDVVERLCKECATGGDICQIANHLFPRGFTVAGTIPALEALEKKATDAGALQAKMQKTSGAFHTPIMAPARDKLLKALNDVSGRMSPPRCQIYMNVNAEPIGPGTPVEKIIEMLGDQLTNPVKWLESMQRAIKDGCSEFYELGPSKQLKAMMKRIDPKMSDKMKNVTV